MVRMVGIVAAALALGLASAAQVQAKSIPDSGISADDVAAWLKEQGQDAKISDDGNSQKLIVSTIKGIRFGIYMFDCNGGKCGSIQFTAVFSANGKIPVARVNEWNRTMRWSRVYLDDSNGIWIKSDVDLTPGGTYELLNDNFATWKKMVDGFRTFFKLN